MTTTPYDDATQRILSSMGELDTATPRFFGTIYGNMSVGKTTLGMEIAQGITSHNKRILYVDSHAGWVVLKDHPGLTKRTSRLQYTGIKQLMDLCILLKDKYGPFADFETVILDEATSMSDIDLIFVTETRAASDKSKDPDTPLWPDMNAAQQRFMRMENQLLQADVNVIFLAHERTLDIRGINTVAPGFKPELVQQMSKPMHLVGQMFADLVENPNGAAIYRRFVQVHPSKRVIAKCRLPDLPVQATPQQVRDACFKFIDTGGRLISTAKNEVTLASELDDPKIEV